MITKQDIETEAADMMKDASSYVRFEEIAYACGWNAALEALAKRLIEKGETK